MAYSDGAAQISRWITSEIETSQSSRLSITERNGVSGQTRQTGEETFAWSQTNLFALRYAPDPWYNKGKKQWETVAFIDRDEAWTMYEPQVRQRAEAFTRLFNGAETEGEPFRKVIQYQRTRSYAEQELDSYLRFAEIVNPRGVRSFSAVRDLISAIPQGRWSGIGATGLWAYRARRPGFGRWLWVIQPGKRGFRYQCRKPCQIQPHSKPQPGKRAGPGGASFRGQNGD